MDMFSEEVLFTFLRDQGQLYDEPVAQTPEAAEEFLADCLAVVVNSIEEVRAYLEDSGMDVDGMSDDELLDQAEVFPVEDGTFLILEG